MMIPDASVIHLDDAGSAPAELAGEIVSMQQWLDHSSWEPLGASHDIQACWDLLGGAKPSVGSIDAVPVANPEIGDATTQPIPRFVPKQTMGVGAFGVVIGVYDQQLQRPTAMKILRPSIGRSPELIARLVREARTVASIEHPGIVRVYETGSIGGQPFLAVELVEGPDLAKHLRQRTEAMSFRQSVWLMQKVTSAVQFAHNRGVLHRDLKPSNILLAEWDKAESEGLGFTPRLTDFGLAKVISSDLDAMPDGTSQVNLTGKMQILGTVRYMSPEQADGRLKDVAITSDVFSLGVILFELLTGKLPFDAVSDRDVMHKICHSVPDRPRRLVPNLPRDLEAIVLKALEKKPEDRYVTAGEMHADLSRYMRCEPVLALPYSYVRHFTFQLRKHPAAAAAILVATVTSLSASALVTNAWLNERKSRAAELAAKEREAVIRQEREVAQNQTLAALNDIFFKVAERLNNGEQISQEERVDLLKESLRFHSRYVNESPLDFHKRHRLSIAFHHLGNALENASETEEAMDARRNTLRLLDDLLLDRPNHPTLLFQKSVALLNLSHLFNSAADPSNSKEYAAKSLSILERLAVEHPSNTDFREVLTNVRFKLVSLENNGKQKEAQLRAIVQSSVDLWESTRQQPKYAKHAIFALTDLGELSVEQGRYQQAYADIQAASDLFERVFASIRTEAWVESIERRMIRSSEWTALKLGKWKELEDFARRGIAIDKLQQRDETPQWFATCEILHLRFNAIALRHLGQTEASNLVFQQASLHEKEFSFERDGLDAYLARLNDLEALNTQAELEEAASKVQATGVERPDSPL